MNPFYIHHFVVLGALASIVHRRDSLPLQGSGVTREITARCCCVKAVALCYASGCISHTVAALIFLLRKTSFPLLLVLRNYVLRVEIGSILDGENAPFCVEYGPLFWWS